MRHHNLVKPVARPTVPCATALLQADMDIEADKREATVFASSLVQQVNREDVANMVLVQRGMLQRFEKTNEMLINFNQLSFSRYEASVKDFQGHTQLLYDMKKDLDSIFKRIRVLKQRLSKSYPEAFAACSNVIEEDEEDHHRTTTTTATSSSSSSTAASTRTSSGSASRKRVEGDGSASKTRIGHAQKVKPAASRSREGGSGGQVSQRKTGRPRPEGRETASTSAHAARHSSSHHSRSKPL